MLTAFFSAFRTPDLRKKILFTLFILVLYRMGAAIPSPGVDYSKVDACIQRTEDSSVFTLLNLFSGGALLKLSVLALGIMPYITASIILQLLTVVIPRLEQLKKEGPAGQAKITQYTRYLTLGLAILQASGYIALARSGQLFNPGGGGNTPAACREIIADTSTKDVGIPMWLTLIIIVAVMTAGTAMIMWFGEMITDRGIGNGMSVLIFASIAAQLPGQFLSLKNSEPGQKGWFLLGGVIIVGIAIIAAVVFIEQSQRRIPVQYAKRMVGRRMYGGSSTYIPMKVNQAGVIPVIFGSSLLYIPTLITQFYQQPGQKVPGWVDFINTYFVDQGKWSYTLLYFALIIFFTYFYVSISFNPNEVAENMKKFGGFIPGVRPGKPTARFLDHVQHRLTPPGAIYLGLIAILPNLAILAFGGSQAFQNFPFGGTSVLIMVGVGLESVKQIESQLMQRNYEGFLR
ncbi:preprotein translocase subunit SecY [Stackebrandtia nassauensis]|uniref:Protein translocase subunit SecY n=1 Tax=Stackebrandtia nassauensis (strain DSM 44728 / CIP 108903 / NRRL B-16338 / NBRC 102104 / LLR-40K-21) TaxID=446470 RepID=D3QB99_STANL|nr:preprotein translocase subunit SecY [Stackebrandtia nassauensis]ADD40916.1 preprotein translocase, SecY subunit [Stackebrandtia nassauensis DSM 44728]